MANPDFSKMVGPLPLGAWVAVVGGGLAFMVYQRKQADIVPASSSSAATSDPATDPNLVGAGGSGQFVDVTPPTNGGGVAPTTISDNESWGKAATDWLIAQGYDPIVSDSAIRKYLDQESGYSSQEYALVKLALGHIGSPPDPLPAPIFGKPVVKPPTTKPPVTSKPPAKKPVTKPKVRYYTVRPGDTLSRIGKKYHVSWQSIYNANKHGHRRADGSMGMISNYNLIRPGWRLIIPNS